MSFWLEFSFVPCSFFVYAFARDCSGLDKKACFGGFVATSHVNRICSKHIRDGKIPHATHRPTDRPTERVNKQINARKDTQTHITEATSVLIAPMLVTE